MTPTTRSRRGSIGDFVRPESLAAYKVLSRARIPAPVELDGIDDNAEYARGYRNNQECERLAAHYASEVIKAVGRATGQAATVDQRAALAARATGTRGRALVTC